MYFDILLHEHEEEFTDRFIFNLNLWVDLIINFVDNSEQLNEKYAMYFMEFTSKLIYVYKISEAENIINLFLDKIAKIDSENNLPYTYFEIELSSIKEAQGKYQEEFDLAQSAYKKRLILLGSEDIETVSALSYLANSLRNLGKYKEAVDLEKQILAIRKDKLGNENTSTIKAMGDLAITLNYLGNYDESLKLKEQVLLLSKEIFGEKHP